MWTSGEGLARCFVSPLQGQAHGKAAVLRCLLSRLDALDGACEQEVSRAARMALWEYTPGETALRVQTSH